MFTGNDNNAPDLYNPSLQETLVYNNTNLFALLGDDDFDVTWTYPDGSGLGISESVTFTTAADTAIPEVSGVLPLALGMFGAVCFHRRRRLGQNPLLP